MSSPTQAYPSLYAICSKIPVSDTSLKTPIKSVVTVKATSSLLDGFKKLVSNNILSAPVKDKGKWIGFLDLRDLVSYVNHLLEKKPKNKIEQKAKPSLVQLVDIAALDPSINIIYLARRNPFRPLDTKATLWDAMKKMASRVKRIPIIDEKGEIVNIISQSSVVRLLSTKLREEKKLRIELSKITAADVCTPKVVSVHKDALASEVFKVMSDKNLSGIAVTDNMGTFLCSTQASDLKLYLAKQDLNILRKPIRQFLAEVRQQELVDLLPNVSVKPKDTIATVIEKLAVVKMHRVFVAETATALRPTGVVSISDVLKEVVKNAK